MKNAEDVTVPKPVLQENTNSAIFLFNDGHDEIQNDLADSIKRQLEQEIQKKLPSQICTTRQLCGDPFWAQLSKNNKIRTGIYVSYLVANGHMPLIEVKGKHEYPKKYMRN